MKFNVYPDGDGDKSDEIDAPSPREAVLRYLNRNGASGGTRSIEEFNLSRFIVIPICDKAKALDGLTEDEDGHFWAYDVEANVTVHWRATPV